jgi:hypothetical protein
MPNGKPYECHSQQEKDLLQEKKEVLELLGEIERWCSGEIQGDDVENAEDALRYIQDAIRAWRAKC